jgi:hypothetical protein
MAFEHPHSEGGPPLNSLPIRTLEGLQSTKALLCGLLFKKLWSVLCCGWWSGRGGCGFSLGRLCFWRMARRSCVVGRGGMFTMSGQRGSAVALTGASKESGGGD